jgi:replicative DNA helicase
VNATAVRADEKLERLVLGTWVSDERFRQAWQPDPDLFYYRAHQAIGEVFHDAFPAKRWNETYTIAELSKRDLLRVVENGKEGVLDILGGPVLSNPLTDVDKLRELRALRTLRKCALELEGGIAGGERLAQAQERMRGALEQSIAGVGLPLITGRDLMSSLIADLKAERAPVSFCTTGWRDVDKRTGGLRFRWVALGGSDTSWGKTAWTAQMIDVNLHFRKHVLVVTTEDDPQDYRNRLACRRAGVTFTRLRDRTFDQWDIGALSRVAAELEDGLFILDGRGVPIETLEGQIRAACAAYKIHLVIVDYIHATECERDFHGNRPNEIRYIGRKYTTAIKRSGAAGFMFAQLTMQQGRPNKEWIRDCKDLVKAAEQVYIGFEDDDGRHVLIDKAKHGKKGMTIDCPWNNRTANFKDDVGRGEQLTLDADDEEAA